jgi:formylglycine-generating enzyme required for sulfatase activity
MDLPTEAEWEYACRAGSATELYCDLPYTAANVKSIAWTRDNASKPREVGTSRPNAWGIYDMIGNVWELCLDAMGTTTSNDRDWLPSFHDSLAEDWATGGITVDPIGASNLSGRIVKRGGSWYEKADISFSTNYRNDGDPSWASGASGSVGYIGARLFCSVPAAVK